MKTGISVSPGIGIAKALVWKPKITFDFIPRFSDNPEEEVVRYYAAQEALKEKLAIGRKKTALRYSENEAAIFDAYLMMLEDDENLKDPIVKSITENKLSAEYAVTGQFTKLAKQLSEIEDEYLSQRSDDVINLRDQILGEIIGLQIADISRLDHPTILVTHMLSPADMADFDFSQIEGIICETGGYSSHTGIIARTLGIPAIFGVRGITSTVNTGDFIAMDGEKSEVWVQPAREVINDFNKRHTGYLKAREQLQIYRGAPSITTDNHRLELASNVGQTDDIAAAISADAESIGLFRTELIFRGGAATDEDSQFRIYKTAIEKMNGKSVTFRTYDDARFNKSLRHNGLDENPSLGYRGIRMSLGRPSFFRTQLRALLRASAYGSMKIMFPMLSTVDEQNDVLAAIKNIKKELIRENVPFDEKLRVGFLIETPAAALAAHELAKKADFFTVGVNDLLQFTLAVDRTNPTLGYLYHYCHPSFLRLLKSVVDAAHQNGITCNFCGELPNQIAATPLLLGLEPDGFSINPNLVLPARQVLNGCSYKKCKKLAHDALKLQTSNEVMRKLSSFNCAQE